MNIPREGPRIRKHSEFDIALDDNLLSNTSTYPPVLGDMFSDPSINPSLPLSPPISSGVPDYDSILQIQKFDNICFVSTISSVCKQRKQLLRATEALKLAWFCKFPPPVPLVLLSPTQLCLDHQLT
jgi:hypothetical protein